MGHLPVIANTFRVTINWNTVAGCSPRNVFHVRTTLTDEVSVGLLVDASFQDGQFTIVQTDFAGISLDVLALDGSSATVTVPISSPHVEGQGSGDPMLSAAAVIAFQTGVRGAAHRGRMYLGPIGEGSIDGGTFSFDPSGIVAAWADFQGALIAQSTALHHVVASYTHHSATDITQYRFDLPLATQRRRLLQTRH